MTPRTFAGIVGAALTLFGLILLFLPVSATVNGISGTCNSSAAFNGLPHELIFNNQGYNDWQEECTSGTTTRHWWSGGLIAVGLLVVVGSSVIQRPTQSSPDRDESGATRG